MRTLIPIHLIGNALLLWLGYYWLGLGESSGATLLWSALVALVLISLTCLLHARTLKTPFLRLFSAAIAVLIVYILVAQWSAYSAQPAFKIASYLTNAFRKPVKPATVQAIFNVALWLIRWMVVPVIALSLVTRSHRTRNPLYWIEVPILLLCAIWLPLKLIGWVPHVEAFSLQMASFVVRALVAYLLFVAGTLALEFLTQSNKVASP